MLQNCCETPGVFVIIDLHHTQSPFLNFRLLLIVEIINSRHTGNRLIKLKHWESKRYKCPSPYERSVKDVPQKCHKMN